MLLKLNKIHFKNILYKTQTDRLDYRQKIL